MGILKKHLYNHKITTPPENLNMSMFLLFVESVTDNCICEKYTCKSSICECFKM